MVYTKILNIYDGKFTLFHQKNTILLLIYKIRFGLQNTFGSTKNILIYKIHLSHQNTFQLQNTFWSTKNFLVCKIHFDLQNTF
jgi:hypothetical protein